jgi:outer membrane receptor for ferrienterochelin and colicin
MRSSIRIFLALFFLGCSLNAWTQTALEQRVSIAFKQQPIADALRQLIVQTRLDLLFSNDKLPKRTINLAFEDTPIKTVLNKILEDTGLGYRLTNGQVVLVKDAPSISRRRFVISGFIEKDNSGERLISATVFSPHNQIGALSNGFGYFSLSLPEGETELIISYLGCQPLQKKFTLHKDTTVLFSMMNDLTLEEFTVVDGMPGESNSSQLELSQVGKIPKFAGETDLIRAIHLLPGVQTGADGMGGIFVRGGEAGHNLVIIDDVPVYNFNHGAGLLSLFNTSTIKSVDLLKGAFPARYSGRLSSVLDVRTRDGNKNYWEGSAEVGLVASRLTVEGPIFKGKGSILLSGRFSFLNWYLQPATQQYKFGRGEDGSSSYRFYDFNAKVSYDLSPKDKIYLSYYRGMDKYDNSGSRVDSFQFWANQLNHRYRHTTSYSEHLFWENIGSALRWNRVINNKLFVNTTATYSQLKVEVGYDTRDSLKVLSPKWYYQYEWDFGQYRSSIKGYSLRSDFQWSPLAQHVVRFGINTQYNTFQPGAQEFDATFSEKIDRTKIIGRPIGTMGASVYAEDSYVPNRHWRVDYGLNVSTWKTDARFYSSLEPRFVAFWKPTSKLQFKTAFTKMAQFMHLLTSSNIGLPTDLWVPSTGQIAPEVAWQGSLGSDLQISRQWQFGVEGYYKIMRNLVNYIEGANYLDNWEENITIGKGKAYGIDFFLRKTQGKTTGWISYSLARTNRVFEKINFGNPYPFRFDHRHDLKVAAFHSFSKVFELTGTWIFSSGLAYSLPLEAYTVKIPDVVGAVSAVDYGAKNQFRLPAYTRLDLSLNIYFQSKGALKHTLNVGVYNLLNRRNPLYYKLDSQYFIENNQFKVNRRYVGVHLLPILPSLNYSIKF